MRAGAMGHRRDLAIVVLSALGLAAAVMLGRLAGAQPAHAKGHPYVSLYDPPKTRAEVLLNRGDGQAFAALARDPTLARPAVFGGSKEAAYRAQRPLEGWLGWTGSLGAPGRVPLAIIVTSVAGIGVLIWGVAETATDLGKSTIHVVAALALPGTVAVLTGTGPEGLGTGLALVGIIAWRRGGRGWAALLLTLAVLARETLLFVVLGLLIHEVLRRSPVRRWWMLCIPLATYAAWSAVIRLRLHVWSTQAAHSRLAAPWNGLLVAAGHWHAVDLLFVSLGVALAIAALVRPLPVVYRLIAAVYLVSALFMGADVWGHWNNFGRPLLPLYIIGLVALLPAQERRVDHAR